MTMLATRPVPVKSTPIDIRVLPRIDGTGLCLDEWFKISAARNGAQAAFAADNPEATPGEIDRAGDLAAARALRDVLRARPPAPPLATLPANLPEASCCSPSEALPCSACIGQDDDDEDDRYIIADDVCPQWIEREPGLTLETVIQRTLDRLARHPEYAEETDLVVWHSGCVHAVIGTTEDGTPYALRCDEHPEADWTIKTSLVRQAPALPFGNDVEHDPAWQAWLDGIDRDGPEPTQNGSESEPSPALLTLPELIEQEAARLRRMETDAGDLMARTLAQLAKTVRFVQAKTPADYEARIEVLERDEHEPEMEPELTAAGTWA